MRLYAIENQMISHEFVLNITVFISRILENWLKQNLTSLITFWKKNKKIFAFLKN